MGKRADRRKNREEIAKANEQMFPDGKIYFPPSLIYRYCIGCENHAEFKISYNGWMDVFKSSCKLKYRKPYEVKRDSCGSAKEIVNGKPDIKEKCPCLAGIMMDADIEGLYKVL